MVSYLTVLVNYQVFCTRSE